VFNHLFKENYAGSDTYDIHKDFSHDRPHDLVVLKASVVDAELEKLDLKLRTVHRATRMVSPTAYEAGGAAGASLAINPGIRGS
jgi:hypothetical protein